MHVSLQHYPVTFSALSFLFWCNEKDITHIPDRMINPTDGVPLLGKLPHQTTTGQCH